MTSTVSLYPELSPINFDLAPKNIKGNFTSKIPRSFRISLPPSLPPSLYLYSSGPRLIRRYSLIPSFTDTTIFRDGLLTLDRARQMSLIDIIFVDAFLCRRVRSASRTKRRIANRYAGDLDDVTYQRSRYEGTFARRPVTLSRRPTVAHFSRDCVGDVWSYTDGRGERERGRSVRVSERRTCRGHVSRDLNGTPEAPLTSSS